MGSREPRVPKGLVERGEPGGDMPLSCKVQLRLSSPERGKVGSRGPSRSV